MVRRCLVGLPDAGPVLLVWAVKSLYGSVERRELAQIDASPNRAQRRSADCQLSEHNVFYRTSIHN